MEYNRVNLAGSIEYLGWTKGTIAAWNRSKGYLVNFEGGDQEWPHPPPPPPLQLVYFKDGGA